MELRLTERQTVCETERTEKKGEKDIYIYIERERVEDKRLINLKES
jgi:hypothetical protein